MALRVNPREECCSRSVKKRRRVHAFLVRSALGLAFARSGKKFFEQSEALDSEHARGDFAAMIQVFGLQQIPETTGSTAFGVRTAKDDPADASVDNGTGAHGTRLFGDKKVAVG